MSLLETLITDFNNTSNGHVDNGAAPETNPFDDLPAEISSIEQLEQIIVYATEGASCLRKTSECADPGAEVHLELDETETAEADALERIITSFNNLLPVAFLAEGVERQKAVARIALKRPHSRLPAGAGWGTGWLVSDDLLMTNNHVIPTKAFAKNVRAEFNYQSKIDGTAETPDWYDLDPDSFFVTNVALDYTLVRVKCRQLFQPQLRFPWAVATSAGRLNIDEADGDLIGFTPVDGGDPDIPPALIARNWRDVLGGRSTFQLCAKPGTRWGHLTLPTGRVLLRQGTHVNIIQHPRGRRKEVAVQQNRIDRIFGNVVRYTTDTEPGSSGSPVFNNAWDLLAIHHAGGDRQGSVWINNEGIRMDKVVTDLRRQIPASSAVRRQLGI